MIGFVIADPIACCICTLWRDRIFLDVKQSSLFANESKRLFLFFLLFICMMDWHYGCPSHRCNREFSEIGVEISKGLLGVNSGV